MSDLFGFTEPAPIRAPAKPKLAKANAAWPTPTKLAAPAEPPVFGSPEWERCPCGRWATMHFPLVGGLRRCVPCARSEGRMHNPGASA